MQLREHPLLMKGPLVRATLEGRKTQTRRPIKCGCNHLHEGGNPVKLFGDWSLSIAPHQYDGVEHLYGWRGKRPKIGDWIETVQTDVDDCFTSFVPCPLGRAGDRLWVRETWRPVMESWRSFVEYGAGGELAATGHSDAMTKLTKVALRFPGGRKHIHSEQWHPSIHMPRWACRLVLPLVSVRVERVQDITEEDAKAEGVEPIGGSYREGFRAVWQDIYGTWDANPWVWVAEWKEWLRMQQSIKSTHARR